MMRSCSGFHSLCHGCFRSSLNRATNNYPACLASPWRKTVSSTGPLRDARLCREASCRHPGRPGGRASAGASRVPSLVRERRSGPLRHRSDSGDGCLFRQSPGEDGRSARERRRMRHLHRCQAGRPPNRGGPLGPSPARALSVGVDFIDRCGSKTEEASFRVVIDGGGGRTERVGTLHRSRFEPVVVEFDLPTKSDDSASLVRREGDEKLRTDRGRRSRRCAVRLGGAE